MRKGRHCLFAGMFVLIGACAGADASETVTVADSAGITVVSVPAHVLDNAPHEALQTRLATIGGAVEDDVAWITSVALLHDGSIAFINGAGGEVRVHDASGDALVRFGRAGEGPGEFRAPWRVMPWRQDSVAIWDVQLRRVSIFSRDGSFGRSLQIPALDGGQSVVHGATPGGHLIAGMEDRYRQRDLNRVRRDTLELYRLDGTGEPVRAGRYAGQSQYEMSVPPVMLLEEAPFAPYSTVGVVQERAVVADNGAARIAIMDSTGAVQRLIQLGLPRRPVTADDRRAFEAANIDESWRPTYLAAKRQFIAEVPVPSEVPAIGDMVVGSDGSYWISEYVPAHRRDSASRTWWVLSADGDVRGRVTTPERFTLHAASADRVVGVQRDEMDVEAVVVYAVRFGDPGPRGSS